MARRSEPLAAQKRQHMLTQEDKARRGSSKTSFPRKSSCTAKKSAIEKGSTRQTDTEQQEIQEQAVKLSPRRLRPRPANLIQATSTSIRKGTTRRRRPEAEAEQATDHRRKRSRKLGQQRPLVQQPKDKKQRQDALDPIHKNSAAAPRKWERRSTRNTIVDTSLNEQSASQVGKEELSPIAYWTKTYKWPKRYAERSDNNMNYLLARQKPLSFLRGKRAEPVSAETPSTAPGPSDQAPREVKSAPYQDPRYELLLSTKGSFMDKSVLGITEKSKETYLNLLNAKQTVPSDSLFPDYIFKQTCRMIEGRRETILIRNIYSLIVPSMGTRAANGAKHRDTLIDSINEGWNNSISLTGTRPQPDLSVGFKEWAFTEEQCQKLTPFTGNLVFREQSFFMATDYMYFPFLTCEVKCGTAALDIADRQNAHSMTLAVRAIVELFRLVGREMELHREILAFSISHDDRSARIYGHYPEIDGKDTRYYRHPIREFSFTALDGKEKWTAYRFTKNVYDTWIPSHFKRLCSAIDQIPADLDFSVPQLSKSFWYSQDLEPHHLSESNQSKESSQQSTGDAKGTTPDTSFTDRGAPKRTRKGHGVGK